MSQVSQTDAARPFLKYHLLYKSWKPTPSQENNLELNQFADRPIKTLNVENIKVHFIYIKLYQIGKQ